MSAYHAAPPNIDFDVTFLLPTCLSLEHHVLRPRHGHIPTIHYCYRLALLIMCDAINPACPDVKARYFLGTAAKHWCIARPQLRLLDSFAIQEVDLSWIANLHVLCHQRAHEAYPESWTCCKTATVLCSRARIFYSFHNDTWPRRRVLVPAPYTRHKPSHSPVIRTIMEAICEAMLQTWCTKPRIHPSTNKSPMQVCSIF